MTKWSQHTSGEAQAAAYCTGKVKSILVRSNGQIAVLHAGANPSSSSWMIADTSASETTRDRWVSLLNAALLSGRDVQLAFFGSGSCGSMPNNSVFGYVLLND